MGVLSHMPLVVLLALSSVFFLAAFTQAVHALFIATRREVSPARVIFAYEMLIVVHLVLACCTANSASRGFVVLLAQFRPYAFPLDALLWVNLAIAAFGLVLAIAKRRPVMTLEIVLIALCTPPIISLLGDNCVSSSFSTPRFSSSERAPASCSIFAMYPTRSRSFRS